MGRMYGNPFDNRKFKHISDVVGYVKKYHQDKIPKQYNGDVNHYMFDYRHNFKGGKCQMCGNPTEWDPTVNKYKILCEPLTIKRLFTDPFRFFKTFINNRGNSCADVVRAKFKENSLKKDGTFNYMEKPEFQQKLLENRKIARVVNFKGKEFTVIGSYEERFVKVISALLFSANDLEAPGPQIDWVDTDGKKRLHITDFFLPKHDCVVSVKDGGENKNNHPSMKERRHKDAIKFNALINNTKYHCIELNGTKEIDDFPKIFKELKQYIKDKKRFIYYPEYYKEYYK